MTTLREFARTYRDKREGLPSAVAVGAAVYQGVGLDWILEDNGLADRELRGFALGRHWTSVLAGEAIA